MIELGCKAKDIITGFEGVVIGIAYYLTGCNQVLVQAVSKKKHEVPNSYWLDIQKLEKLKGEIIKLDNGKTPGFDKQAPTRN